MQVAEPISSIDPKAFVAQVRQKRAERLNASVSSWRTFMQTRLDPVLRLADADIDRRPDIVAWMFPLAERSRSSPQAPIVSREALRTAVQTDPLLRYAMVKAWRRMLTFYGLGLADGKIAWLGPRYWWSRKPSAHDRKISRMLRCMHTAGITEQSSMLIAFLEADCADVPTRAEALAWWRSQVTN